MSVPALRGTAVTLRPMTYDDLPHLMRWGSDPDFRHYQWAQKPGVFAERNARAWIERMSRPGESACWVIEQEGRECVVNRRNQQIDRSLGQDELQNVRLRARSLHERVSDVESFPQVVEAFGGLLTQGRGVHPIAMQTPDLAPPRRSTIRTRSAGSRYASCC